jgi:hypothetical protein
VTPNITDKMYQYTDYITFVMSMEIDYIYFQHNNFDIRDKCYQDWLQYGAEENKTSLAATME